MGLQNIIEPEEWIPVKISEYKRMAKAEAERELMMNAVQCEVPYVYVREMVTGAKERPSRNRYGVVGYRQRRR